MKNIVFPVDFICVCTKFKLYPIKYDWYCMRYVVHQILLVGLTPPSGLPQQPWRCGTRPGPPPLSRRAFTTPPCWQVCAPSRCFPGKADLWHAVAEIGTARFFGTCFGAGRVAPPEVRKWSAVLPQSPRRPPRRRPRPPTRRPWPHPPFPAALPVALPPLFVEGRCVMDLPSGQRTRAGILPPQDTIRQSPTSNL